MGNFDGNTYTVIGDLPTDAESILLFNTEEDDNDVTYVFAGGNFINGTKHSGLGYAPSDAPPSETWTRAGGDTQFLEFYKGDVGVLLYTSGGVGANDTNGYDPSYTPQFTSSSGGMSGVGIFFLILFIMVSLVVIVGLIAGGGYLYWKKRQQYQAL